MKKEVPWTARDKEGALKRPLDQKKERVRGRKGRKKKKKGGGGEEPSKRKIRDGANGRARECKGEIRECSFIYFSSSLPGHVCSWKLSARKSSARSLIDRLPVLASLLPRSPPPRRRQPPPPPPPPPRPPRSLPGSLDLLIFSCLLSLFKPPAPTKVLFSLVPTLSVLLLVSAYV
jgi:hypothetical protein